MIDFADTDTSSSARTCRTTHHIDVNDEVASITTHIVIDMLVIIIIIVNIITTTTITTSLPTTQKMPALTAMPRCFLHAPDGRLLGNCID
ncbi:unnamed protein product [Thelazia callipaeda]|uniref:Uncharacterized protein n=1 Tax=Thelazia callipaeda TaxID=103827 RepID=A0A0N5CMI4_THECL|nr:unnamed protein product [Thelazia callipaeda]